MTDSGFERGVHLKPRTVNEWKRGRSKSYFKHIASIARFFGVTTDYLLGNDNTTPSTDRIRFATVMGKNGPKQDVIEMTPAEAREVEMFLRVRREMQRRSIEEDDI